MAVEIFDPNADREPDGIVKHMLTMGETSRLTPDQTREKFSSDQNWPLQSFDAQDWAKAFMAKFGDKREQIDEGLMLSWFASALMRGWDEREWRKEH